MGCFVERLFIGMLAFCLLFSLALAQKVYELRLLEKPFKY